MTGKQKTNQERRPYAKYEEAFGCLAPLFPQGFLLLGDWRTLAWTISVTRYGRICLGKKKINFSTAFAGQAVGIKEAHDDIWVVSFMNYGLGYFDLETRTLEPLENPFAPKVLPMS